MNDMTEPNGTHARPSDLVTQPNLAPTAKVTASIVAGAAVTVLVFVLDMIPVVPEIPAPVTAALVVLLMAAAAWAKKDRAQDQ